MDLISTEEYLRSTSILAQKIAQDMDAAREAYQDLWSTLSEKEQQQVLDESIIDPAAVLKYSHLSNNEQMKYLGSECTSQFTWFTRSQLNLFTNAALKGSKSPSARITETVDVASDKLQQQDSTQHVENRPRENNLLNRLKNKVTNLKISTSLEEKQNLVENKPHVPVVKPILSKPKTPPPPPPPKQVLSEKKALLSVDNESDPDDIPKTGFDFLDNW